MDDWPSHGVGGWIGGRECRWVRRVSVNKRKSNVRRKEMEMIAIKVKKIKGNKLYFG